MRENKQKLAGERGIKSRVGISFDAEGTTYINL